MFAGALCRYLLAFLALILACLCAGCAATVTVEPGRSVAIGLSEYRLRPSRIVAQAGHLTIDVHNYGLLSHDLVITEVSDDKEIADSGGLPPGGSDVMPLDLAPGEYRLESDVAIDQSVFQTGTLTITPK